eukprot:COSAG05_NODE_4279_length_1585_cov_2.716016_1_plen_281_part_00
MHDLYFYSTDLIFLFYGRIWPGVTCTTPYSRHYARRAAAAIGMMIGMRAGDVLACRRNHCIRRAVTITSGSSNRSSSSVRRRYTGGHDGSSRQHDRAGVSATAAAAAAAFARNSAAMAPRMAMAAAAGCCVSSAAATAIAHLQPSQPSLDDSADRRPSGTDEAQNAFFWAAFKSAMLSAGHQISSRKDDPDQIFDFDHNEDFRHKTDNGHRLSRGGENYELPFGYMRYAVRVKDKYDDGSNTWLGMRNKPGEWAVAYHGTDHCNLPGILANGLHPGGAQA